MIKTKILLLIILFLAAFLRIYRLSDYPAFNADEAAIGYNAYSLIETGKDEHGNPWPIHFQSFNDFKPGLYIYIVLPFVKFFGLNEWSVRLPGALFGVASVLLIYFLAKEIKVTERLNTGTEASDHRATNYALIASLFLAVSPWHLHFSRGGWEVNTSTFFIMLGVYLFLKGLKSLPILMLSTFSFALSLYTYHAARVVVPLLGLGLLFYNRKEFLISHKKFLLAGLFGVVLLLPLLKDMTKGTIVSRAAGVGLFADQGPVSRINEQRGEHDNLSGASAKLLHNKVLNYGLAFFENWGEHYHGEFLFLTGDSIQRNKVPETGELYLVDILFLLTAVIGIIKMPKRWEIILFWLFIAPMAAALTFQSPHALRSHNMVIPLTLISAYGCSLIVEAIQTIKQPILFRTISLGLLGLLGLWNVTRYLHMYYIHMSKEYPYSSQYGVKELVNYTEENSYKYENIVVTDRYDQPYILFLFYTMYPPAIFQNEHVLTARDSFGFSTVRKYGKYNFQAVNIDEARLLYRNSLIAGTDEEIPETANIVKEILGSNGFKYFELVTN